MMRKGTAQKMLNEYCTVLNGYLIVNVNGYKPLNVNDASISRKCE